MAWSGSFLSFAGRLQPVAAATAALLVAAVLLPSANDAASAAPAKAPKPAAVTVAPDAVSAQVDARAQGKRVEVLAERTETSQTFANPDGSFTSESTTGVARVRDASAEDGWRDVDLSLTTRADGTIAPVSPVDNLVLSGGGAGSAASPLVSVSDGTGANSVSLSWPDGDLPKPVLSGDTATYKDVRPGQDLVVQATRTGFEQFLVLKSKPSSAAAAKLALPVVSHGLSFTAKKSGNETSVQVTNKAGNVVGGLGAPMVSDARVDAKTGAPAHTDVADQSLQTVGGKPALVIAPSQDYLDAATYPVTIDPSVSMHPLQDIYVDSGFPTTNYTSATLLHIGTYDSGTHIARAFVKFTNVPISGTQILSSTLKLWEEHASSCTATSFTAYKASTPDYAALTWNTQPTTASPTVSVSSAAGCGTSVPAAFVSINAATIAQSFATAKQNQVAFGLKTSESANASYKRFNSGEASSNQPTLSVTYNRYAGTPSTLSVAGQYTVNSVPYVRYSKPTLQAKSTDADGDKVTLDFELYSANTSASGKVGSCSVTVASGTLGGCVANTTNLTDNKAYYWRVGSHDTHSSTWVWTNPLKMFTTAIAAPAVPTISCPAPYTNGSWQDNPPTASLSCTVKTAASSLSSAPVKITTSVDGAAATSTAVTKGSAGSKTVTVSNAKGAHKITAYSTSVDAVNSATVTYTVGYGQASITSPTNGFKTANTVHVATTGPPRGTATAVTAQLQWSGPGVGWTNVGTAATVTPSSTTDPTSASFDWDTTNAAGGDIDARQVTTLQLRVHYVYTGGPTQDTKPITVVRIPHAFDDGFPTADAGTGQVALWTGELKTSSDDVSVTTAADSLGLSRDFYSYQGPQNAVNGIFGPGWTASLDSSSLGYASAQVVDENIKRTSGQAATGSIILSGTADGDLVFAPAAGATGPTPTGSYTPVGDDTAQTLTNLAVTTSSSGVKTLTATQHDGTATTWTLSSASGTPTWTPAGVSQPGQQGSESFSADGVGRITRILAAQPYDDGISCPATGTLNPGCAALTLRYTGTGTATRLAEVDYVASNAAGTAMVTTTVATYTYDSQNRLATFTDRSGVTTTYTYTTSGNLTLLASETTDGQAPWKYEYDGNAKLQDIKRGPASGSGDDVTDASFAYGLSPTAAGMPDVTAATVQDWGQQDAPTKAWAVFGLDHPVAGPPSVNDLQYAHLYFTDDEGYTVNTAVYGAGRWLVTWQDYDSDGTATDSLTATQTAAAVDAVAAGDSADTDGPQTVTRYLPAVANPDDADDPVIPANTTPTDVWSAVYEAADSNGDVSEHRQHTHYVYDSGAPNGDVNPDTDKPYLLPTEVLVTVADSDSASDDPDDPLPAGETVISDTIYGYDPIDGASSTGPSSGWTLGQPTVTTKVLSAFGEPDVTTKTLYGNHGETLEVQAAGSNGGDSLTTQTIRYAAGSNSADPLCGNKPQWAGMECWTGPAAAPTQGADVTDKRITGYDYWLNPTTTVETSGVGGSQATRTTTETYLVDGRPNTEAVFTSGLDGSAPVPSTQALYDQYGRQTGTAELNSAGVITSHDNKTFDQWGRQTGYTNSLGETTTTSYVGPGKPGAGQAGTVTTPVSTSTYSYDGTDAVGETEHRGLATSLTVSGVGTYSAAYDSDGNLTTQTLPAGITEQLQYDSSDRVTSLEYDGQVTDPDSGDTTTGPWLSFSRDYDESGKALHDWSPAGASNSPTGYTRQYGYDGAGRLVQVNDASDPDSGDTSCSVRQYGFDEQGNRTNLTATNDPDGCTTDASATDATQTSDAWTYDANSRQLTSANSSGSYSDDVFGRQLTIPAGDAPNPSGGDVTLSYFDTDAVRSIAQGGVTTTYTLDPSGRRLVATVDGGDAAGVTTDHYADGGDNPAWVTQTTGSETVTSAYTTSIGAGLSAQLTTTQGETEASIDFADIEGAIVATATVPDSGNASGVDGFADYGEYGQSETPALSTGAAEYGWLGTAQRAQAGAGLILMGARLYNPETGRFTSADPVDGGNENAYNYPNDPVNSRDVSGAFRLVDHVRWTTVAGGHPSLYIWLTWWGRFQPDSGFSLWAAWREVVRLGGQRINRTNTYYQFACHWIIAPVRMYKPHIDLEPGRALGRWPSSYFTADPRKECNPPFVGR